MVVTDAMLLTKNECTAINSGRWSWRLLRNFGIRLESVDDLRSIAELGPSKLLTLDDFGAVTIQRLARLMEEKGVLDSAEAWLMSEGYPSKPKKPKVRAIDVSTLFFAGFVSALAGLCDMGEVKLAARLFKENGYTFEDLEEVEGDLETEDVEKVRAGVKAAEIQLKSIK